MNKKLQKQAKKGNGKQSNQPTQPGKLKEGIELFKAAGGIANLISILIKLFFDDN